VQSRNKPSLSRHTSYDGDDERSQMSESADEGSRRKLNFYDHIRQAGSFEAHKAVAAH